MLDKIKQYSKYILSILGIIYLFNLYRKFCEDPTDVDISGITDRIKDGEDKLKEIDESDPEIETILEKWND
jgi:hypothetical protein